MTAPLHGLRVLDFTTLLPGPMATLILAEAGATVIKVERPGPGEEMRAYPPRWGEAGAAFHLLNRGKRGVRLDLKAPAHRAIALRLAAEADVLVEQFRPGVMDRLGLGFEAVRARNPRIVHCAITGYGQTGPKRLQAGHDLNYVGDAGLLSLSAGPAGARVVPPALVADIAGGAYPAVMNILMALRARDRTGTGSFLDVAMAENVLPFAFWAIGETAATGRAPGNGAGRLAGGSPRYRLYDTRDGRIVAVAALEDKFWQAFCKAVGLEPALADDGADPAATGRRVAALIAGRDAAHWQARFAAADCCCTIVKDIGEVLADPHFAERGVFAGSVSVTGDGSLPALPVPLAPALRPEPSTAAAPATGEDPETITW